MPIQFQLIFFAVIAAFVLFQLYNVLGKRVGRQPEEDAKNAKPMPGLGQSQTANQAAAAKPTPADAALALAASGLKSRDPAFDPSRFLEGARTAYETIVRGYAAGDREALRPLLAPHVMDSFEAGIAARETRGDAELVEFPHPPRADLESADAEGDRARARVRFLAELRSKVTPSGGQEAVEERRTAEVWTFERTLGDANPNWVLARVEPATA
ncbi:MAG: TIM44-related membrane protein TimA [Brevundimonas sp.]|uniref:TIM44-related membrane protein TimA n=1 Tax=Brevundimonas sp. TaxID=1871086 RepID=UPI00391DA808